MNELMVFAKSRLFNYLKNTKTISSTFREKALCQEVCDKVDQRAITQNVKGIVFLFFR